MFKDIRGNTTNRHESVKSGAGLNVEDMRYVGLGWASQVVGLASHRDQSHLAICRLRVSERVDFPKKRTTSLFFF